MSMTCYSVSSIPFRTFLNQKCSRLMMLFRLYICLKITAVITDNLIADNYHKPAIVLFEQCILVRSIEAKFPI